jgi:uncharacterized protein (TIGR03435 family)
MRLWSVGAWVLAGVTLLAQSPPDRPTFQVTSVRPNRLGGPPGGIRPIRTGQVTAVNVTLRALILRAYALHESQLIGGPAWLDTDRFDVVARTETPPAGGTRDVLLMLRQLLAERFSLRMHTETRQIPAYELRMNRADGRPGPNLRLSTIDCATNPAPPTPNTAPTDAGGWPPCGLSLTRTLAAGGRSRSQARHSAQTMQEFALAMQTVAGRAVIDRTGLTGVFDLDYAYVREDVSVAADTVVPADAPDLFSALREQLGLRLEAHTSPVEVYLIDRVEPPTAN